MFLPEHSLLGGFYLSTGRHTVKALLTGRSDFEEPLSNWQYTYYTQCKQNEIYSVYKLINSNVRIIINSYLEAHTNTHECIMLYNKRTHILIYTHTHVHTLMCTHMCIHTCAHNHVHKNNENTYVHMLIYFLSNILISWYDAKLVYQNSLKNLS